MTLCSHYPELKKAGVQVVGVSVDRPEYSARFEKIILNRLPEGKVPGSGEGFPFQLLSDAERKTIHRFGLVDHSSPMGVIAIPATVLVDGRGIIEWTYRSSNYRDRPSPEDILSALNS